MVKYILYYYSHHCGGLGDFFKFFIHAHEIAAQFHLPLLIWLEHPMEQYLIIKNKDMVFRHDQTYRHISGAISDMVQEPCDAILIRPPDFYATDFLPCSFPYAPRIPLYDYFDFQKEIHDLADRKITTIFDAVHVRCGDKYLEVVPSWNVCPQDDRTPLDTPRILRQILQEQPKDGRALVLFSDNDQFKKEMHEAAPGVTILGDTIVHTGLRYKDKQLFHEGLVNTLVEFVLISRSETIFVTSKSGFPWMAHFFSNRTDQTIIDLTS